MMSPIIEKLKKLFSQNELKFVMFLGLCLVAILSFEAGLISGKNRQNSPIIIENPTPVEVLSSEGAQGSPLEAQKQAQEAKTSLAGSQTPAKNCVYVGSKNSNKYHVPTCRFAKLIKPENAVCFSSVEDASAKNYLPDKGCIK